MGISYQDVGMVNDSLEALSRAAVMRRAEAREKRRDALDERRANADDTYRSNMLAGSQAEAAANRTFRTASAEAEKAHQERLATQQGSHFKAVEQQNTERNAALKGGLDARESDERNQRIQKHLDWLKDGVEKEVIKAEHANTLLQSAIKKAPPEMFAGTPFDGLPANFFKDPTPKKATPSGKISIATDEDGKTTRTITRDLSPDDEKAPEEPDQLESSLAEATRAKISAKVRGDKKGESEAQATIDRILPMMEEAKGATVDVYDSANGVLKRRGSKPTAVQPAAVQSPRASESLATPSGTYTTTAITEDDIPAIVNQRAKIKDLEKQLHDLGTSAPERVSTPIFGGQAGGGTRITTPKERQAYDARVRKLIDAIAKEQTVLDKLRAKK